MKLIVQNLATEYQECGEGETLLLLHGWKDSLHSFDALVARLPNWHIVSLDLPGFGKTECSKKPMDLDDYVDFVAAFVEKMDLDVKAFIGHSFGGRIIIKGCSTKKINSKKIVLIGSAGIARNKTLKNRLLGFITKIGKILTWIPPFLFFRNSLRNRLYASIQSDYLNAGPMKETFKLIIAEDLQALAGKLDKPTLLIWGEKDEATPLEDGKTFSELISDSRLEVIPKASHFVHKEYPAKVAQLIQNFL